MLRGEGRGLRGEEGGAEGGGGGGGGGRKGVLSAWGGPKCEGLGVLCVGISYLGQWTPEGVITIESYTC